MGVKDSRGAVATYRRTLPDLRGTTVIVSSLPSDAHTWNLVYLHLLIEELGYRVVNLGPCVPARLLLSACVRHRPGLVVISSINGHGYQEGVPAVRLLRSRPELAGVPMVIGGKLGTTGPGNVRHVEDLLGAGFDAVFEDGAQGLATFRDYLAELSDRVRS
jgi:methylaspartate mutase sigma subunit